MTDYKKLQNGSDVRGVALPGVEGEAVILTPETARSLGASFGRWLASHTGKASEALRVAIGRDSRLSGPDLLAGAAEGLAGLGIATADCGMASTPAMFMATVLPEYAFDGSIMVTASHLPWNRNGLKFFVPSGGLESSDIRDILGDCRPESRPSQAVPSTSVDILEGYCAHLREVIRKGIDSPDRYDQPLLGFRIAVDAGNGAGGFFAGRVLEPLGADTSSSIFLEPDGTFPNHIPNPENPVAMAAISAATVGGYCDLGLIFDTDVDRAAAVDETGRELSRNKLIGLMAAIVAEQAPGSVIVTDSVTSAQLKTFIEEELGCVHHRFQRGYKNVINEAVRLNAQGKTSLLAIETSGHGALQENYFLDDGAYLSAKILIKMVRLRREGSSIGALLARLTEPLEAGEFRAKIACEDFRAYGNRVLEDLAQYAQTRPDWQVAGDNYEGLRATVPAWNGWFLLRLSLHDPQMPLNIESDQAGGVLAIYGQLREFLGRHDKLMW